MPVFESVYLLRYRHLKATIATLKPVADLDEAVRTAVLAMPIRTTYESTEAWFEVLVSIFCGLNYGVHMRPSQEVDVAQVLQQHAATQKEEAPPES